MSATKRSGSLTEKASPLGSHATTELSSLHSISISFLGNGFEPELPGEDVAESAGDDACPLLAEEVRVILRAGPGISIEEQLPVESVEALPGDVPSGGTTFNTPAAM